MEELIIKVEALKEQLNKKRPFTQGELERLAEEFGIEYTYDSNAIEGSTLTLEETALVIKEGITIAQKPLSHHLAAIGHKDAYVYIRELVKKNVELSESEILNIHSLVLMDRPEDKGRYRTVPVRIMGSNVVLPQPYLIKPKIEELLREYTSDTNNIIEKIAKFHLDFERIHPFIDGNGRTGRLVLNFELMKAGYLPINIKNADKQRYYECFKIYDETQNYEEFVKLVCTYLIEEFERYIKIKEERV